VVLRPGGRDTQRLGPPLPLSPSRKEGGTRSPQPTAVSSATIAVFLDVAGLLPNFKLTTARRWVAWEANLGLKAGSCPTLSRRNAGALRSHRSPDHARSRHALAPFRTAPPPGTVLMVGTMCWSPPYACCGVALAFAHLLLLCSEDNGQSNSKALKTGKSLSRSTTRNARACTAHRCSLELGHP